MQELEMEQTIRIVTDSACDLPPESLQELGIEVVPLTVNFGTEVFYDGELSADEFWARAAGPYHPQTSQPSVGAFVEVFERLVTGGRQVLCVTITSKHSGTFNSAHLASQRFGGSVQVFDSLSLSVGQGYQALQSALGARAGQTMHQLLGRLEELRSRMHLWIVLDTLENLRLGGRADGFISIAERMTRALNIKAIVSVTEGQLRLQGAARSLGGALSRVQDAVEHLGSLETLAVIHVRNPGMAEQVADQLAQRFGVLRERIWVRETGPALSTHGGRGVVGVLAVPVLPKQ
jgi:DegV family protein with EDD domain